MELTQSQLLHVLKRFPEVELSYETVSHKKVLSNPDDSIALAIPLGRKYFLWFTYREGGGDSVCYSLGLDKDKQICSVEELTVPVPDGFSLGTKVYCTLYEDTTRSVYIAEDIYQYRGIHLHNLCFGDRAGFLFDFVKLHKFAALPIMWTPATDTLPADLEKRVGYTTHHIQHREIRRVAPYINVLIPKKGTLAIHSAPPVSSAEVAQKLYATAMNKPLPIFDYGKPSYRYPAVFHVMADSQLDLYHLHAYGGPSTTVYCGLAGIQSYKTSVFMNRIFRRIRENENLDLAEESEDEADFENMDANKFVNLDLVVEIECVFNLKHKKWIPVRMARKGDKIIHIEKLAAEPERRGDHRSMKSGAHNPYNKRPYHK